MGTKIRQHKSAPAHGFKVLDEAAGTFEAIVSVFDNVDFAGEVVKPGAFKASLERWATSGDPIPVIFSHQWDDLDAHVGTADPSDVKELLPGDPLLPPELAALGGLYVKGTLETDEDFAGRLWKRMSKRAIREFSFAYDVVKAKPSSTTGAKLDLLELDLIEVGPTLKGMNPATALLAAKSRGSKLTDADVFDVLELADELVDETAAALAAPKAAKAIPSDALAGAVEVTLSAIVESATVWAGLEYGNDLYAVRLEGTFLEDSRAIVTTERWEDPLFEGPVWELAYTVGDDGTVTIDDATPLEVTVELAPARAERSRSLFTELAKATPKLASTARVADAGTLPTAREGKAEEPSGAKAEDPTAADTTIDEDLELALNLAEADLDLDT